MNAYEIEYETQGRRYITLKEGWTSESARQAFLRDNPGCEIATCDLVPPRRAEMTPAQHNAFPKGRW